LKLSIVTDYAPVYQKGFCPAKKLFGRWGNRPADSDLPGAESRADRTRDRIVADRKPVRLRGEDAKLERNFMKTMQNRSMRNVSLFMTFVLAIAAVVWMRMERPVGAAPSASGEGAVTVPIDPTATFLHAAITDDEQRSDAPAMPAMVDLTAAGFAPGAEMKLSYQVLQPFSFNCNLPDAKPDDPVLIAVFANSSTLFGPDATTRLSIALKTGDEIRTGPVGLVEVSEPDDIEEDFQIMPVTGTTVRIPAGATHLFLGVADSYYKDNCGQLTVTLEHAQSFDVCLQDDASGDILLFNSFTGDYRFIRCGTDGFVHNDTGGRRAIRRQGCTIALNDALVSAVVDVCNHRGSATVKNPNLIAVSFPIRDSYTKNNTGRCR
jgi:hypothetical protein